MDKSIRIGKQDCVITETDTAVIVTGKFRNKAGRLLPRMDEKLVDGLREMGYPVGYNDSNSIEMYHATFQFSEAEALRQIRPEFKDSVVSSEGGQLLIKEASTVSRRDCLAQSVGFSKGDQKHRKINNLQKRWNELCLQIWSTFSHPYKYLLDRCPVVHFGYEDYSYRTSAPVRDGDIEWLRDRLDGVAQKIESLECEQ